MKKILLAALAVVLPGCIPIGFRSSTQMITPSFAEPSFAQPSIFESSFAQPSIVESSFAQPSIATPAD
jgi:hypothetical protein